MQRTVQGQRKYLFFALFTAAICVLALYIHRHRQGQTGRIDNFLITVSGGLQKNLFYLGSGVRSLVDHYVILVNAKKESEILEKEVTHLRSKLAAMEETELENSRLREALQFRKVVEEKLISAHVVAHDVSNDYFGIRIDRGSNDGARVGMGVVSSKGVVGRILRVSPRFSDVLTLLDPTSNVDAVIQRSRARGIVSGQAKQVTCKMKYLDQLEDVMVSDTVVSSGFGGIFPKGLLIGYVTAVIPSPSGPLQTITVKTAVDIYRLEEVFIVFPGAQPEATS